MFSFFFFQFRLSGYEPFFAECDTDMYKKIIKCDFVFDSPWWDDVSDNAKVSSVLLPVV